MAEEVECIVEERKALIVPPTGKDTKPIFRTAHFLKPAFDGSKPPLIPPSSFCMPSEFDTSKCSLKVNFCSWKNPSKEWKRWAAQMELKHRTTWKKAGILKAIRASTRQTLIKDPDLLFSLSQIWFPETNTFIFRWGEATVTLEDVMVSGPYSVLGSPVSAPLETEEAKRAERQLHGAWFQVKTGCRYGVPVGQWVNRFMGSETEFEHEAFLALWLSRFVLPQSNFVLPNTFPVAIRLARGTRVALAPAVLAAIYRDLSIWKRRIDRWAHSTGDYDMNAGNDVPKLNLWALFQLVQVWVWERFPTVRPNPNPIRDGESRITRWIKRKCLKLPNMGKALNSGIQFFQWRPYARLSENLELHKFYPENDEWVLVGSKTDDELLSFAQFLIPRELVGLDACVEQYLPYRVGMQFGMDQDLPCSVDRSCLIGMIGCTTRPITDIKVYVPSRISEAGLTARYSKWWEESRARSEAPFEIKDVEKFKKTPQHSTESMNNNSMQDKMERIESSVPPGFEKKWKEIEVMDMQEKMERIEFSVPPGFEKKWKEIEVMNLDDSSNPEGSRALKTNVQMKEKWFSLSVPPSLQPKQNEVDIPESGGSSRPKGSEVLTSVQNKIKEVDLSVHLGLQRNRNEVEVRDSDNSSDEDHLTIEQFLRRQDSGSIGNSTVGQSIGPSTLHVVSSTSDNLSPVRGKSPVENVQSIMEDEANIGVLRRAEDNVEMSSERGVSIAENTGSNLAELTVKNLQQRLSRAEGFLMEYLGSGRAEE